MQKFKKGDKATVTTNRLNNLKLGEQVTITNYYEHYSLYTVIDKTNNTFNLIEDELSPSSQHQQGQQILWRFPNDILYSKSYIHAIIRANQSSILVLNENHPAGMTHGKFFYVNQDEIESIIL